MIGTIVNIIAILIGSSFGLIFHSKVPQRYITIAFNGIGMFTLILGVTMAIKSQQQLYMIFSIIMGSLLGEFLDLDAKMNGFGDQLKKRLKSDNNKFTDGLITAFLMFCMGAMTILGAINAGVSGDQELLFTKSLMDGFASLALASTLGLGVMFSVIPLLIYQGGLTLLASQFSEFMMANMDMVTELSAVGGLLLIGLGLNILDLKHIKITNMLPSLIFIVAFMLIFA